MVDVSPIAIWTPLILLSVYFRVRRNLGRQKLRPIALRVRAGLLLVLLLALALSPPVQMQLLAALFVGSALGVALAGFALKHTRFETIDNVLGYTPNSVIGLTVSGLLIGRLGYRLYQLAPTLQEHASPMVALSASSRSPLTLVLLALVLSYNAAYALSIGHRARQLVSAVRAS